MKKKLLLFVWLYIVYSKLRHWLYTIYGTVYYTIYNIYSIYHMYSITFQHCIQLQCTPSVPNYLSVSKKVNVPN
jgi:hypothetical protein